MAPSRTQDKSFVCDICNKRFSGDRARHLKRHAHDKEAMQWTCSACGFGDLQKHNVLQHYVRRHTADRPYQCPYKVKDALGRERPCSYRCQNSSSLTKHKTEVHRYIPRKDNKEISGHAGKLRVYEKFVVPPRMYYESLRESSPSPDTKPKLAAMSQPPPALYFPFTHTGVSVPCPAPDTRSQFGRTKYANVKVEPDDSYVIPKTEPVALDNYLASTQPYMWGPSQAQQTSHAPYPRYGYPSASQRQWVPYSRPPTPSSSRHW